MPMTLSKVTQSTRQAQEALILVKQTIEARLGLKLSEEKTHISTYGKGYQFLGFFISSRSRRMRDKSKLKFKDKVRVLTQRHHNLDNEAVVRLNRVIRGTANYFAPMFATNQGLFQKLDSWIRMRLRCMKKKRKSYHDNHRLKCGYFERKLGLVTLEGYCWRRDAHGEVHRIIPRHGATSRGPPSERSSCW
jgi:RNA-directed DNA polymerase